MRTEVIFEDKDIIVCHKPAGLAVQSGRLSEPDMVSELKNYLARGGRAVVSTSGAGAGVRCGLPAQRGPVYLGIIHRLDQPVSGILVFAKNQRAAAALSRQTADHTMQKTYRAAVMKNPDIRYDSGNARELTDYIVKEPGGGARIAASSEKDAKKARLIYRCLQEDREAALLEIELKTGRHHQIRVQLAHAGMPILGDNRYGTDESRELSAHMGIRGILLQAAGLCFVHPATGKKVNYELEKKMEL